MPTVDCGQKLDPQTFPITQPLIVDIAQCVSFCPLKDNQDLFHQIVSVSSWSLPESKDRPIKRETFGSNPEKTLKKAHFRATLHDRSAIEVKNSILNGEDLALWEYSQDLSTKLGLRRSQRFWVDYWKPKGETFSIPLVNPAGTAAAYYYIQGEEPMDWILLPTSSG